MITEEKKGFIDKILQNRVVTHTLFWLLLVTITTVTASMYDETFKIHLINNLSLLPVQIGAAYFLAYYQIPKLLLKKKYLLFLLSGIASIFVFSVLARLAVVYISEPLWRTHFVQESLWEIISDWEYLLTVYFTTAYLFSMVFLIVKTIKEHFEQRHQLEILKKEKATAELNFLKAQIHPHFLFNTLNNLYSLTLGKSDDAPEVVLKLSEMLDYMLYQCSDPTVEISKEVELMNNYIDLELLRYGNNLDFKFNKDIDDNSTQIAPLILLSLIENAFKHGASGNLVNPTVHIDLKLENENLVFKVFNTKPVAQNTAVKTNKKGVGATNIKKQLSLMYPNKHQLTIDDKSDSYSLILEISL